MNTNIDVYICYKETVDSVLTKYAIVKTGNLFFNKYAVVLKGDKRYIFQGSSKDCQRVIKAMMSAGMDAALYMKEEIICNLIAPIK